MRRHTNLTLEDTRSPTAAEETTGAGVIFPSLEKRHRVLIWFGLISKDGFK